VKAAIISSNSPTGGGFKKKSGKMKIHWTRVLFLLLVAFIVVCSSQVGGAIIFCAGDSITEVGYPHFLKRILNKEGIRARVLNYGRSGFTSGEYLRFLERNQRILSEECPDFVLLQLGTNDVREDGDYTPCDEFKSNMEKIIEIFQGFRNRRGEKTEIFLATIPPVPEASSFPFSSRGAERVKTEINPLLEKIAEEKQILKVDNYSLFLKFPHFLPEVHPTEEGYRALAQNWFQSLNPYLKKK